MSGFVVGTAQGLSSSDVRTLQCDSSDDVNLSRTAGVSREQLQQLRQDVRTGLNDALFTRLSNMEEVQCAC